MSLGSGVSSFDLGGLTALVTGGSKGIGLATAALFRDYGARVVICGRSADVGEQAADTLGVEFVRADVSEPADVEALLTATGPLDILVNNAGPTDLLHSRDVDGPLGHIEPANWARLINQTLTSAYLPTRAALAAMVERRRGSIVNISSITAALVMPGFDAYATGKGGLEAMTRAVAAGYGHLGIRCNAIRVGAIAVDHGDGGRSRGVAPDTSPDAWRRAEPPSPGRVEDVAHAALFLASAAGGYVNGAVLPVDGGLGVRSLLAWQTPRPEMLTAPAREPKAVADRYPATP
ncbi:MAG: SDR family NAD(P)-dependent oxidoreductase [Mycobacteriales bacterium]